MFTQFTALVPGVENPVVTRGQVEAAVPSNFVNIPSISKPALDVTRAVLSLKSIHCRWGQSWEDATEQHPSCKPKRCHGFPTDENHHEPWSCYWSCHGEKFHEVHSISRKPVASPVRSTRKAMYSDYSPWGEGHLDIAKLSKYFLDLGDSQALQVVWFGDIPWYTINLTTCMSEWHVDPLVKSAFCCLPYRILQILISNIQVQMVFYCTDLCRWNSRKHGTFSPSRQVGTAETPTRRADSCGMSCFWPNTFLAFGLGYEVCVGKVLFLCLVADTWWYTHDDTQCRCSPDNWHSYYQFLRTYRIFQHPRLIGQNNVPSWHGVFWPLIFLQHCPISAFGLQRGERDRWSVQSVLRRDVASRVREARELSGDEDPFSQPLFPLPFYWSEGTLGHPGALQAFLSFFDAKAPHFCTSLRNRFFKSRDPLDWCNPSLSCRRLRPLFR